MHEDGYAMRQAAREAAQAKNAQEALLAAAPAVIAVEPPDGLVCPITSELLVDPVLCADGHSYERTSIEAWLADHDTSPLTGARLQYKLLVPNHALRKVAEEWRCANAVK